MEISNCDIICLLIFTFYLSATFCLLPFVCYLKTDRSLPQCVRVHVPNVEVCDTIDIDEDHGENAFFPGLRDDILLHPPDATTELQVVVVVVVGEVRECSHGGERHLGFLGVSNFELRHFCCVAFSKILVRVTIICTEDFFFVLRKKEEKKKAFKLPLAFLMISIKEEEQESVHHHVPEKKGGFNFLNAQRGTTKKKL